MKTVACYVRVSTQEQARTGFSIGEQSERLELYCKAHGWSISSVYTDPGFSGASMNRPALQRLIRDAEAGRFSAVLVYKLDRLSRSQKDTMHLIEDVFLANRVDFISMSENFGTSTPFGRAMIGILSVFAQLERDQIKERMAMGIEGRARMGKWHGGGNVPIGYQFVGGKLLPDPYEAMQVRRVFELFQQGHSMAQIAREMAGYTTRYGPYKENNNRIALMLRNPVYIGKIKTKSGYVDGEHEALVPAEVFAEAQIRLDEISKAYAKGECHTGKYFLSGLCRCGVCGANFCVTTQGTRKYSYQYYRCHNRLYAFRKGIAACESPSFRKEELDDLVLEEIRHLQMEPGALEQRAGSDDSALRIRTLQDRLQEVEKQIERTVRLYSLGTIDDADIETRLQELYSERTKVQTDIETAAAAKPSLQKIRRALSGPAIDEMEEGERHRLAQMLIDHITVSREGEIQIKWAF